MAEKHIEYGLPAATTTAYMHQMYTFIASGQSGILRFATDASFAGVNAISIDGTNYGVPVDYTSWGNNSYFVVEPVNAYPGGGRWQLQVKRISTSQVDCVMSFDGAWDNKTFTAGATVKTASIPVLPGAPLGTEKLFISASNSDTYDSGTKSYTYFRVVKRTPTAAEDSQFGEGTFYAGGYIPAKPTLDTKPACFLARNPRFGVNSNYSWGYWTANASNYNRTPVEYAHTTLDLTSTGYCAIIGMWHLYNAAAGLVAHTCEGGDYVDSPVVLVRTNTVVGAFGSYTMRAGYLARADGTSDSAAEYLVVNDLMIRWKPSA